MWRKSGNGYHAVLSAEILSRAGRWESLCASSKSSLPPSAICIKTNKFRLPPFASKQTTTTSSLSNDRSIVTCRIHSIQLSIHHHSTAFTTYLQLPISRNGGSATSSKLGSFHRCLAPCMPIRKSAYTSSTSFCQCSCRSCYDDVRTWAAWTSANKCYVAATNATTPATNDCAVSFPCEEFQRIVESNIPFY